MSPPGSAPPSAGARLRFVALSTLAIVAVTPVLLATGHTGWPWAMGIAVTWSALLAGRAAWRRDRFLAHLWLFALAFGLAELAVDAFLVDRTGTLDYLAYRDAGGPMVWRSPLFMPLAWQVLVVQLACIADWLCRRSPRAGVALAALVGATYLPYGEEISSRAEFWRYHGVPMIGHVPHYVIVGEAVLGAAVALLLPRVRKEQVMATITAGVLAALALFLGYAGAWLLFGAAEGA